MSRTTSSPNKCVLVLDEEVGAPDDGLRGMLGLAKLLGDGAVVRVAAGVFLRLRR